VNGRILTNDGTYAFCDFGSITPGTELEIDGQMWEDCVAAEGKEADLIRGRSAKIIVNAPEDNVQGFTNLVFGNRLQRVPMQIHGENRSRGE
jgi:hypothetical protein